VEPSAFSFIQLAGCPVATFFKFVAVLDITLLLTSGETVTVLLTGLARTAGT
jgi:hypothetical protein